MTSKPEIKFTKLFINNEFVDSVSGKTFATIDPTDETEIAQISEGDKADVDKAVKAARKAFEIGKNRHFFISKFSRLPLKRLVDIDNMHRRDFQMRYCIQVKRKLNIKDPSGGQWTLASVGD